MSKTVLIIEDEEILSRVLRDKFEDEGWEVDTAFDGEDAMKQLTKKKYGVLLLDLLMPNMDGFEVIEKVRSGGWINKNSPIIVMSNLGDDDSIQKAISLGANEYFVKNQHPIQKILERAEDLIKK